MTKPLEERSKIAIGIGKSCGADGARLPSNIYVIAEELLDALQEATQEVTCPICNGKIMESGEFCVAGCRDGKVRWTSANVLNNTKFWRDTDREGRKSAELRAHELELELAKLRRSPGLPHFDLP
jgi:hypothetical protein